MKHPANFTLSLWLLRASRFAALMAWASGQQISLPSSACRLAITSFSTSDMAENFTFEVPIIRRHKFRQWTFTTLAIKVVLEQGLQEQEISVLQLLDFA